MLLIFGNLSTHNGGMLSLKYRNQLSLKLIRAIISMEEGPSLNLCEVSRRRSYSQSHLKSDRKT